MKKANDEVKLCKSKNCKKVLPQGYKHKYCEACRTKHAETIKNVGKGVLSVGVVALAVVTKGHVNLKKD